MIIRAILPQWALDANAGLQRVIEGDFTDGQISDLNDKYYNIYWLPNGPSLYDSTKTIDGSQIDDFKYVFVDMDLKDGKWTKASFIEEVKKFKLPPSKIVDSGNGIHAYWKLNDLDSKSYLRLQRRLLRYFKTDEAVGQIFQLMRLPDTVNTKDADTFKQCNYIENTNLEYTCEDISKQLPSISLEDEQYCVRHYERTYKVGKSQNGISEKIPLKFAHLVRDNKEVKDLWSGITNDRSKSDYRVGHIMFANGFTREEALSVLVNSAKALERAPYHRVSYAENIVDKIWTYEIEEKKAQTLSCSVKEILSRSGVDLKGTRFPCWRYFDATHYGFRLGQVIGLVAGSGVGKTTVALNMFLGFIQSNPDYVHFFVPLEQPANEIAERWQSLCGNDTRLHDKVHIISNYDDQGNFRNLSLTEIREYLVTFQTTHNCKVGCVVIDHINALKMKGQDGENQGIMDICHEMKSFAIKTNTMLIMQSQTSREKAGIGDLELNKDAAYGTVLFESYCDYLITVWQPLKRVYEAGAPTVTAFKFCKIRHKKAGQDSILEDVCYRLFMDPETGRLRELTQVEEKNFDFFNTQATNKRKADRKTDVVSYKSLGWMNGKADINQNSK